MTDFHIRKTAFIWLTGIFFLCLTKGYSQERRVVRLVPHQMEHVLSGSLALTSPAPFIAVSAVFRGKTSAPEMKAWQIRFSTDQKTWSEWMDLEEDPHANQSPSRRISVLIFAEGGTRFFEIKKPVSMTFSPDETLEIHFYNPGKSSPKKILPSAQVVQRTACGCEQPPALGRLDWCPDGTCFPHPNPSFTEVTHLIVHHTATSNTASDWAAVVRSIWDFHVNVNGWSDIGYNYLIDPEGVLYEGRGNDILGAHFCGKNTGTMGTAMIGNFSDVAPTEAALNTLQKLLAWKICDKDLDPLGSAFHPASGKTLHRISGHREGCSTECPGDTFFPLFPDIRQGVKDYIDNGCSDPVSVVSQGRGNEWNVGIFPNPTNGELFIEIENPAAGTIHATVYDPLFRAVKGAADFQPDIGLKTKTISLANLPAGVYFLVLKTGDNQAVFRILKQ
ncbi:MAG: T9SS C-terminal target domain-containing protein [Bacteroidetes bacterium]|nr:MAG: T9SS C-terminal target domain-containing protein [Bacteroidota bacterium]